MNYGQVADNLPPPSATAKLLQSTSIEKVRLYGADPAIIKALANTGIGIVIGAANGDIPALATDPNSAAQWVNSNVLSFYPASKIILITVGNEVTFQNYHFSFTISLFYFIFLISTFERLKGDFFKRKSLGTFLNLSKSENFFM